MRTAIERWWIDELQKRVPIAYRVQDAVEFDYGNEIGASITDGERRWAFRVGLSSPDAMDAMVRGLSRAWVSV